MGTKVTAWHIMDFALLQPIPDRLLCSLIESLTFPSDSLPPYRLRRLVLLRRLLSIVCSSAPIPTEEVQVCLDRLLSMDSYSHSAPPPRHYCEAYSSLLFHLSCSYGQSLNIVSAFRRLHAYRFAPALLEPFARKLITLKNSRMTVDQCSRNTKSDALQALYRVILCNEENIKEPFIHGLMKMQATSAPERNISHEEQQGAGTGADAGASATQNNARDQPANGQDRNLEEIPNNSASAASLNGQAHNNVNTSTDRNTPSRAQAQAQAHTYQRDDSIENVEAAAEAERAEIHGAENLNVNGVKRRRRVLNWSPLEEDTLRKAEKKFGKGKWKQMLEHYPHVFQHRTAVDLKDKWRNMTQTR